MKNSERDYSEMMCGSYDNDSQDLGLYSKDYYTNLYKLKKKSFAEDFVLEQIEQVLSSPECDLDEASIEYVKEKLLPLFQVYNDTKNEGI